MVNIALESKIQQSIVEYLGEIPRCKVTRVSLSTEGGVSDLLVCYRGRFIALEVKRIEKAADPLQIQYINDIIDAGGSGAVVWSPQQAARVVYNPDDYKVKLKYTIDKVQL
jgi:hypothetical protein